jgi:hypothetical protein
LGGAAAHRGSRLTLRAIADHSAAAAGTNRRARQTHPTVDGQGARNRGHQWLHETSMPEPPILFPGSRRRANVASLSLSSERLFH